MVRDDTVTATEREATLTVSSLLAEVEQAIAGALPGQVWVRGEVTGFRKTSRGAAFFRLADAEADDSSIDVAARGMVMADIERELESAGLGTLRDGVEVRLMGTVGVDRRRSNIRLSLLKVDAAFTAGRLATGKVDVLRRMAADRSLEANARLQVPLVPLRVGLVTSRGTAAHADFIDHLRRSRFRFRVVTAHTTVQGDAAPDAIASALTRVAAEPVDVVAVIRGGGSKLDLAVFDSEVVGRAVAAAPVPVITGIGHEIDRTVADEAAAIAEKTPTAASEWLVSRVKDYSDRVEMARRLIRSEASTALLRADSQLRGSALLVASAGEVIARHRDRLHHEASSIARSARSVVEREGERLRSLTEWFATVGLEPTLERGFALVQRADSRTVVKSVDQVGPGDRLVLRFADGTVPVIVDET